MSIDPVVRTSKILNNEEFTIEIFDLEGFGILITALNGEGKEYSLQVDERYVSRCFKYNIIELIYL
jgi:hypothetical protein